MNYFFYLIAIMFCYSNLYSNEIWKKTFPLNGDTSIKIKCADSLNCVHLTEIGGYSKVYKSNDGGYTWSLIVDNYQKDITQIHNIDYPERNHIFTTCNDQLLNINFIIHFDGDGKPLDTTYIDVKTEHPLVQIRDREIKMLDTNTGIANIGTYFIYTNDSWKNYKILFTDIFFTHITIQNENSFGGYTSSNNHNYIYTEDGGYTFDTTQIGLNISDIFFLDTQKGYLKGRKRLNPDIFPSEWGEVLLKSTDGGRNWVTILDTIIDKYNTGGGQIFMLNENKGTFVSKDAIIVETDDGFKSFNRIILPNPGDKPGSTSWTSLTYSGIRPIVGVTTWGVFTKTDTVFDNMQKPVLVRPIDKSKTTLTDFNFEWRKDIKIEEYVFQLATDSLFEFLIFNDTIDPSTSFSIVSKAKNDLNNCQKYYWRVGAIKQNTIKWSDTWSFTIILDKAILEIPYNNATEIEYDISVNWKELNGAERYHLQCSFASDFNDLFYSQDTLTKTSHLLEDLPEDTEIFWRVRGYCKEGFAEWSDVWKFRTKKSTSVRYSEDDRGIRIKPNPSSDFITIQFSNKELQLFATEDKVQIFDVLGIEVGQSSLIDNTAHNNSQSGMIDLLKIDVSHLPAGVYFIRIGDKVEKFVKM